uniref:Uncharacterized protein n=1 Tax=Acrobeloides nanus TaxID=290746 RepID=A0A914C9I1_9BILA
MSKEIPPKSDPISYGDLVHHFIAACKTGLIMPAIDSGGEKINITPSINPNSPTIIMFGWTGATDRYLSKYGKIYDNQEYNVVRCIASTSKTNTYAPYEELADEILAKLPEEAWKNHIFFHLLSMNGSMSFLTLWGKLSEEKKKCVKGVIFDSAPVYSSSIRSGSVVAENALPPSSGYNWLSREAYKLLMWVTTHWVIDTQITMGDGCQSPMTQNHPMNDHPPPSITQWMITQITYHPLGGIIQ